MKPTGDKIILERIKDEKIGTIYMPENLNKEARKGKVLYCGPGRKAKNGKLIPINPDIKPGTIVHYNRSQCQSINVDPSLETYILREDKLLGVEV